MTALPRPTRVAVVFGVAATIAIAGVSHVEAQGSGRIDLVAQTTFVGDDPAIIDFRVTGPPDAKIQVRLYGTRTTRDAVRATYDGVDDDRVISRIDCFDEPDPLDDECQRVGSGDLISVEFPDDEIGEILRSDQGALPVVIDLEDHEGNLLDTLVTHLLVLDESPRSSMLLSFLAALPSPVAHQSDQSISVDGPSLLQRFETLTSRPDLPVTVALQPETLEALNLDDDQETLATLTELLAERSILRSPWVDLDEEAWRLAGEADRVTEQYALGINTVEDHLDRAPITVSRLDPDGTTDTLALLRTAGTTAVIVEDSQLSVATRAAHGSQPFQITDANGLPIDAFAIEDELHETLGHPDPELAGYRALTELAMEAATAATDGAVVLELDRLDPTALDILLSGVADRPFLRTASLEEALDVAPARTLDGTAFRGTLIPTATADLSERAADLRASRAMVDAYAAMVAPAEAPIAPLRIQLLAAAADSLTDEEGKDYTQRVLDAVADGTSGLSIVAGDRITLTDRQTDLPLTVRNEQPLPITVDLILSAEKLRFPRGERLTLILKPGDNDYTIRVETLASGDARVTAKLTSPGGGLAIGEGAVDIRSTAISGLGLIISIIALLVLGGWWARTILRVRRSRAAATVAPAGNNGSDQQQGES